MIEQSRCEVKESYSMKIKTPPTLNKISTPHIVLAVFMLLLTISLSRFVANGEPRTVACDDTASGSLEIYDGIEITQPVTITEEMNWKDGSYAIKFGTASLQCTGTIHFKMEQGKTSQEATVAVSEIAQGEYYSLPLSMTSLLPGQAVLSITTDGVAPGELAAVCGTDYYGFGEVAVDGRGIGYTLAQKYSYHILDREYDVRRICYLLVIAGMVGVFLLTAIGKGAQEESRGRCLAVFVALTCLFLPMFYIYDSSVLIEPTYAEAVSNFLKYAREESFVSNLLITDAGYLPLLQRLITLFIVKILRVPAEYALYVMQFAACLGCCMMWSFFALHPFRGLLRLPLRVVFCMLVMTTGFYDETLFFTNFVYWGMLLILLFLVSDMEQWHPAVYAIVTFLCALVCLSKGSYVIILPFMAVYLMLFWRGNGRRQRVYAFSLMAASLLQMVYSFSGKGDAGMWIDSSEGVGQLAHWLRLGCKVCVDVTVYFLPVPRAYASRINGILPVLTVLVCGLIAVGFVRRILLPMIRRETVQPGWRALYAMLILQFATAAFYRITVKRVPEEWGAVWKASRGTMGDKYEIFGTVMAFIIWIILLSMAKEAYRTAGTAILALLCICTCANLQLSGLGSSETSDRRTYEGDIGAGWKQTRELISKDAFFVPVREDFWSYCKNVTVYQVGEETYFEEASAGINLGNMEEGYRSAYTLDEETTAENVIEIWIHKPNRIDGALCRATLLDEQGNVLQEAVQLTSNRNFRTGFYFPEPVNGMRTIQFTDESGQEIYIDDYICWISAW